MKIGFLGALTLLLIALKLLGKIALGWVWVLCPLWGGAAFGLAVVLGVLLLALVSALKPSPKPPARR